MSLFSKDQFLNTSISDALSTDFVPIPEHECRGSIKDFDIKTPNGHVILEVIWELDSEEARKATNLDNPTVKQAIFLDLTADGLLDTAEGRNIGLGKLRAALGQNTPGTAWNPSMILGMPALLNVTQRPGKPRADGSVPIYNDIGSIAAL